MLRPTITAKRAPLISFTLSSALKSSRNSRLVDLMFGIDVWFMYYELFITKKWILRAFVSVAESPTLDRVILNDPAPRPVVCAISMESSVSDAAVAPSTVRRIRESACTVLLVTVNSACAPDAKDTAASVIIPEVVLSVTPLVCAVA